MKTAIPDGMAVNSVLRCFSGAQLQLELVGEVPRECSGKI